MTNRDAAVPLYLAATAAVFGVAFGNAGQASLLFAIPAFGLGISMIYTQHDLMIGAISRYLATEYQEQVRAVLPGGTAAPLQWDLSIERRGLTSGFRLRIGTVLVLVALPQVIALYLADTKLGWTPVTITLTVAGATATLFGIWIHLWVEAKRQHYYRARIDPRIAPYLQPLPAPDISGTAAPAPVE